MTSSGNEKYGEWSEGKRVRWIGKDQLYTENDDCAYWVDHEDNKQFFTKYPVISNNDNRDECYVYSHLKSNKDYQCFELTVHTAGEYTFSIS